MREKLYLESESSFFRRFVLLPIIVLLMVVGFVLSAVVFLSLSHVMFYGFNEQSLADLGHFWLSCLTRPQRLWEAYAEWFYYTSPALISQDGSYSSCVLQKLLPVFRRPALSILHWLLQELHSRAASLY